MKKLVKVAVLKTEQCSTGSQCNFSSTEVILAYLLVFYTVLAALFQIHCSLKIELTETPEK